jgi:hypothetical protein
VSRLVGRAESRGSTESTGVVHAGQASLLKRPDVAAGVSPSKPANYLVGKILVRREPDHRSAFLGTSSHEPVSHAFWIKA